MKQIVYLSSATYKLTKDQLIDLLEQSRENNQKDGITGILLYQGGNILQVLEGEAEDVERLLRRVRRDDRHSGFIKVLDREIEERFFPEWSMGFRDLEAGELDDAEQETLEGFSDYLNTGLAAEHLEDHPDRVLILLDTFRRTTS